MTIDEPLDRLTERPEALTQTLEILARTTPEPAQPITGIPGGRRADLAHRANPRTATDAFWKVANK
jgi:hypothetical protein